ncbi:hypothetical protein AFLA_003757 [Aspergillus flavus NRRL3357]|nr:hypothetical protein AFLA_003757 [Aspergillus flavus NRRL3357]
MGRVFPCNGTVCFVMLHGTSSYRLTSVSATGSRLGTLMNQQFGGFPHIAARAHLARSTITEKGHGTALVVTMTDYNLYENVC